MKKIKVVFLKKVFEKLKNALKWDRRERVAYVLCHSSSNEDKIKLMPHKILVPEEKDYVRRSAWYYEVGKAFVNKMFNEAIDTESDVIQVHIHPSDPGQFSHIDEVEEPKFMRHIAEKIEGIYHCSLVFGNSLDTLDGWFYDREEDQVVPIEKVVVVGRTGLELFIPKRSPLSGLQLSESLDRTIQAFGEQAVRKLACLDYGVVGVSALGAPVVEFLTRDKVGSIMMCEPDIIEKTNLNRLPGTAPADKGKPKIEFYADYTKIISPDIEVEPFQKSFYEEKVQRAFSQIDVLFGCVDSGARHSMNRLALANLISYFDLGAGIRMEEGRPSFIGGQVYSVIPGRKVCLSCTGVFDSLLHEFNSPGQREMDRSQGYLPDDTPNPLVMFLDYTIAGIGYNQMLKYVWCTDEEEIFSVHYNGATNKLNEIKCDEAGCINCEPTGFLGKGDKVPFMVPATNMDLISITKTAKAKVKD
jgi:molybdopterin/thiamine biosynthesis adenylyltransferase